MNQGWRLRYRSRTVLKSTMGSRKSFAIVVYNQRNSTQGYLEDIISIIEFLWYLACLSNLTPLNCLLFNEREPKNSTERTLIVFFQTSYSSEEWSNYLEEYRRTIVLSLDLICFCRPIFWTQLQTICCYIARYYIRKWHVRLGVI